MWYINRHRLTNHGQSWWIDILSMTFATAPWSPELWHFFWGSLRWRWPVDGNPSRFPRAIHVVFQGQFDNYKEIWEIWEAWPINMGYVYIYMYILYIYILWSIYIYIYIINIILPTISKLIINIDPKKHNIKLPNHASQVKSLNWLADIS